MTSITPDTCPGHPRTPVPETPDGHTPPLGGVLSGSCPVECPCPVEAEEEQRQGPEPTHPVEASIDDLKQVASHPTLVGSYSGVLEPKPAIPEAITPTPAPDAASCDTACDSSTVATPPKRKRGRPPKPPETHQLHALERATRIAQRREVALARLLTPAVMAWREALLDDLGGADNLSTQQLTIVELAVRDRFILDSVDGHIAGQRSHVIARAGRLKPIILERGRLADSLRRHLEALGLHRQRTEKRISASEYAHGVVER